MFLVPHVHCLSPHPAQSISPHSPHIHQKEVIFKSLQIKTWIFLKTPSVKKKIRNKMRDKHFHSQMASPSAPFHDLWEHVNTDRDRSSEALAAQRQRNSPAESRTPRAHPGAGATPPAEAPSLKAPALVQQGLQEPGSL